jgi:hypothetical protein
MMKLLNFVTIIAALTIVTTTAVFGFIGATAQTMTDNATNSGQNMTGGNNTTRANDTARSGSVSGVEHF